MNGFGLRDNAIKIQFEEPEYKMLIVAEKFQTGFDQPLLHTMYVDRSLGGIQCIQTLSRLNRRYPEKEDTMVIDFRNDPENVKKAFQQYYTETTLEGEVDTQRLYVLKDDIEKWNIFSEDELNKVVADLMDKDKAVGVPSILKRIINDRIVPLSDEDKDLYRKLVNRYVRQYGFMAQLMDFVDPDLEKYYVFCKVFYKYLPYTKEVLPMEILERIDLNKLRIQMNFEGQLELEDEEQTLKSSRTGMPGRKQEEDKLNIKEILNLVNSPYEGFLDENDKILKAIWDEILVDPEVVDAFNANNTWDILLNIVKDKFDEKIAMQIEKYYNFAEVLEKEKSLSLTLMKRFVEALAERTGKAAQLVYDEDVLKDCMMKAMKNVLADVCSHVRSLEEFVDELFFVLNQVSIPALDGINELIKHNLNNIYTNDQIRLVDKIQCFNSLVTKFEAYLKKLYYLIHNEEIEGHDGKSPSLADAIHAFSCLWNLKKGTSDEAKKYDMFLDKLREWRNDTSHNAPTASEQEIDAALQVVIAMYLYVTGYSITDLEMAGLEGSGSIIPIKASDCIPMAADPLLPPEED
jgi:type I restriction enzyme R subunit